MRIDDIVAQTPVQLTLPQAEGHGILLYADSYPLLKLLYWTAVHIASAVFVPLQAAQLVSCLQFGAVVSGADDVARSVDAIVGEPRKERRDAAEHRQRVLRAARELFSTYGVDATSMAEIARKAGVGQGTLYRRYAHKGELCGALLIEHAHQLWSEIDTYLDAHTQEPVLDQIAFFLQRIAAFNEDNAMLLGAMVDAACGPRRGDSFHSPFYQWLRSRMNRLLSQAVARNEIAPLDIEATVDLLLAPLAIDLYMFQRNELGYSTERIITAFNRLVFDGLRSGGTSSAS